MHTHTADIKMVVISGTIVTQGDADGAETRLGPGSYSLIPGEMHHDVLRGRLDCVFYSEINGKFTT